MNKKMNFSKLMKKNTALSLSLILAVCGVLTGCSGSSTKEESAAEITTTTKATTAATTKMTTAATTTPLFSPISDTNGKIFNNIKAGMSKEDLLELFGEPNSNDGDFIDYYVDSNSYLDSYVTYDFEKDVTSNNRLNLVTAPYKYWYDFSFKNGKLYSWCIRVNDHFDSSVSDCIINTIVPILQNDYPGLERSPDREDYYTKIAYNYTFENKENVVLTYEEYDDSFGVISFTDYRYYHSKSGNYDKNDKYYSNNDANNDGYIDDKEFQNAVDDYMSDHGY
ncbi:MAG: hypothetical protein PUA84_04660 [Oscillospiraceae bacterium]|nr:hypothetical protein [Oscillospiraceae bacterium]